MKRIFAILALVALALTSCEDTKPKNQILDPLAKISIKPAQLPQSTASKAQYLDPVEIVQKTTDIAFHTPSIPDEPYLNVGISDEQKDLITPKIMMWGMWIIENGKLTLEFIEAYDVVFVTRENQDKTKPISDTLAYIPNARLRAAEIEIKAAYAAEDYDEVYRLFDEAYKFVPINGADWLELKRQGMN